MRFDGLTGRRALITGASSGIGLAVARLLAGEGVVVGLHHRRSDEDIADLLEELRAEGGRIISIAADLLIPAERDVVVGRFVELAGGLDILVNNAGAVHDYVEFQDLSEASWDGTIAINAKAPFRLCQAAWPYLKTAVAGGRVVNISSAAVSYGGGSRSVHYVAAKAAVEAMTLSLSRIGAPEGIRVNAIRCGVTETDMHAKVSGYSTEKFRERIARVPLGRACQPEEVANLVAFIASDAGAFMTGEIVAIAGGDR